MPLEVARTRKLLADFDLKQLFIEELGWNRHDARLQIPVDNQSFSLTAVAEKRGMAAFLCGPEAGGRIPEYSFRRKIERQVAKTAHEHLIVFVDGNQTTQVWQWVRRERGKPAACREHTYHKGQPGDSLIQKLQALAISLNEEESLTLPDVTGRARRAFDVERVTKKFYDRFKKEHDTFQDCVEGIPDEDMERWYVSVMLNRLMFIYFVQKKGFLDNDPDYLRTKLSQCRREFGRDHYYRDFLCPLFFEGFAKQRQDRSEKARGLLGEVPYLNGGIFTEHQVEQSHGKTIAIPDKAFEKLFEFFDAYHWHLDERPLKQDNEINPDVLGYIFEKYINQKQMGAYYTKEDITEYISKNTVVPFLFDATREKCEVAFEGDRCVWRLLQEDPDRYVYEAVRHGSGLPLPAEIADGLDTSKPNLIERRKVWNRPAPPECALPTEIWREVVARRKRYEDVRAKLSAGEIRSINDLITYNLDIRQFAQDVIENAEGPELLVAFWKAIETVTVLDPACGSGAFLFAALNILEPLYEACLERMRFFLEEWGEDGRKNHPNYHKLFTETLKRVAGHPNYRYFILKSIIVSNLYGVDIMEEAIEICKLRLFLKLVAQIERVADLEPLPDIDFNIRAGNTLVGFTSLDEVRRTQEGTLGLAKDEIDRIEEEAEVADRAFCQFRHMQTEQGMSPGDFAGAKETLRKRLAGLTDELDRFLAGEYGISPDRFRKDKMSEYETAFAGWRKSHQPFHWLVEFFGILKAGGFDVIIGNPPYVEYSKVKTDYTLEGYATAKCGNLYAMFIERSYRLLRLLGRFGFIVQAPLVSTQRMKDARCILRQASDFLSYATFDDRPAKLFDGMNHCRLAIVLSRRSADDVGQRVATTRYHKWYEVERPHLFSTIGYLLLPHPDVFDDGVIPKFRQLLELSIYKKVTSMPHHLGELFVETLSGHRLYYKITGVGHWFTFTSRPPRFWRKGVQGSSTREQSVASPTAALRDTAFCCLWSSLHYWLYQARTNCRDFNPSDLTWLPIPESLLKGIPEFTGLAREIMRCLEDTSSVAGGNYDVGGAVTYEQFKPRAAKPLFDQVDAMLARQYDLPEDELDFIVNYDIKYRMGQDADEDGEG